MLPPGDKRVAVAPATHTLSRQEGGDGDGWRRVQLLGPDLAFLGAPPSDIRLHLLGQKGVKQPLPPAAPGKWDVCLFFKLTIFIAV